MVEPEVRFGQLRHVQLLEPLAEVVRFATQVEVGTMDERWPVGRDTCVAVFEGESTEPVEELAVGASLIRGFTWLERPAWFLMELGKVKRLVVLELGRKGWSSVGEELRVLSFPGGEEVMRVAGVQEIEDALVHAGKSELVVRRGEHVQWIRFSETGEVLVDATVDLGLDTVACAVIARGKPGEELGAWGVGWRGDELFAVPFNALGADGQGAFRLSFDRGREHDVVKVGETLRATAWVSESSSHLGVSWPGYRHAVGKLQVIDVSAEPKVLWEGRPDREIWGNNNLDVREFGQALAFVPDADEDGDPDLLVTGPWSFPGSRIDLLSGGTGRMLKNWSPKPGTDTGHSLSLSGDSRRVLVGGTKHQAYPENLANEGQAHLLDVVRMEKLQTWKLPCRER